MTIDVFAVIADQTRRRILGAVKDSPRPVNDIVTELGVSQPTVSKHLKVLREAGLVSMRAAGQRRLYSIDAEPLAEVVSWAASLGVPAEEGLEAGEASGSTEVPETRETPAVEPLLDPASSAAPEPTADPQAPADPEDDVAPARPAAFPSTAAEPPAPPVVPPNDPVPSDERGGASEPAFASRHARVIFQPLAPLAPESAPASSLMDAAADGAGAPADDSAESAGTADAGTADTTALGEEPAAPAEPQAAQTAPAEEREDVPDEAPEEEAAASPSAPEPSASPESLSPQEAPHAAEPAEEPEDAAEGVSSPDEAPGDAPEVVPALDPHVSRQREDDHEAESKPTGFLANLFGKRRAR